MDLVTKLRRNPNLNIIAYNLVYRLPYLMDGKKGRGRDEAEIHRLFKKAFDRDFDLDNPQTLNEKLQWLKLNVRDDFYTVCADKYAVRNYWKQFGEDALIPLLFVTKNWRKINIENIPDVPCIVKSNTGSARFQIIRNKNEVDYKELRGKCKTWMYKNFYYCSQEYQYKNIKPCIMIEKLLLDKNGHIPNDYKLHYFNGKLQFIYCSVDREGMNYRNIYDPQWKRIHMEWVSKNDHKGIEGPDIEPPATIKRMKEIGKEIAKRFKYVRVDFYDVDGKLYYGEITLHHGSGYDTFVPEYYDLEYGKKLIL